MDRAYSSRAFPGLEQKSNLDPVPHHCLENVALETKANFLQGKFNQTWRQESCMVGEKAKQEVISSRKHLFVSDMWN